MLEYTDEIKNVWYFIMVLFWAKGGGSKNP